MSLGSAGFVVALKPEAAVLTSRSVRPGRIEPLSEGCGLWLSGMGLEAARKGAEALADAGARALATIGVAGALDARLPSGTLLCPQHVLDEQGQVYSADTAWRERLQSRLADVGQSAMFDVALLSCSSPLATAAAKRAAHDRYRAAAVDMESAAVAAVAAERKLPFIVLRAIVDECEDDVPQALQAAIDPWGRPRLLSLFATLMRQPGLLTVLPGLSRRMGKAIGTLRAAVAVTPVLEAPISLVQQKHD